MKKSLLFGLLVILLTITSCEVLKSQFNDGETEISETTNLSTNNNKELLDSLVKVRLKKYLNKRFQADFSSSYTHPESRYIYTSGNELKDEIEDLLGAILVISKSTDSTYYFEESGYYVLKDNPKIETEIKTDKPFFDNIIEKDFSSNVDMFNTVTSQLTTK